MTFGLYSVRTHPGTDESVVGISVSAAFILTFSLRRNQS